MFSFLSRKFQEEETKSAMSLYYFLKIFGGLSEDEYMKIYLRGYGAIANIRR